MGALFRCSACSREMVLEAYHVGRTVPCPWCRADNTAPQRIDFAAIDRDQIRDESRGGTLLVLSVVGFFTLCLPLSGWVLWSAQGTLTRAAEDGRPGDGLVRAARGLSAVACAVQTIVAGLVAVAALT